MHPRLKEIPLLLAVATVSVLVLPQMKPSRRVLGLSILQPPRLLPLVTLLLISTASTPRSKNDKASGKNHHSTPHKER